MTGGNLDRFPAAVQAAITAGFAIVPADMRKRPTVKWGQWNSAPQTDADRAWLGHGSLYAVVTGQLYGFVVLDFDGPAGLATMQALGLTPHVRTAAGAHVYAAHPGYPVKSSAKAFPQHPGLDVKGERSLAYFWGRSKRGAYEPVVWPPVPVTLSAGLSAELFPVPPERGSSAPEGVWTGLADGTPSALRFLDRAARNVRDARAGTSNAELNRAGYSVGGLVAAGHLHGEAAFESLLAAAEERGAGDPATVLAAAMAAGGAEPWTLEADVDDDPDWQLVTGASFTVVDAGEPVEDDDDDEWEEIVGTLELTEEDLARDAEMQIQEELEARTLSVLQVFRRPPPKWLVPGLLQTSSLAEIVGPPTSGKSLLALQWAVDLALSGKRVLYAAAEGMAGFNLRLRALAKQRDMDPAEFAERLDDNLRFYKDGIDLADEVMAEDLVDWATRTAPWDLVVIDTLARAVPGVEENSAKEMGAAVHVAERLKIGDGTVLLVHHSGHDSKRGRGSSAVLAACDSVIHCFPTSDSYNGRDGKPLHVKVSTEKLKDGRATKPLHLRTEEIDLGSTRDGEWMTSVVLVPLSAEDFNEERAERLVRIEEKVRQAMDDGKTWSGKGGARDSWHGDDRKFAKEIWDRLTGEAAA